LRGRIGKGWERGGRKTEGRKGEGREVKVPRHLFNPTLIT